MGEGLLCFVSYLAGLFRVTFSYESGKTASCSPKMVLFFIS